jgi:hypothetical protein
MNKSITALLLVACIFLLYSQFSELAYKFGFAELKLVAVLENSEKMKVKCDAYSLGFFDEIKLQNKYQKCINDYEAQGFTLISRSDS